MITAIYRLALAGGLGVLSIGVGLWSIPAGLVVGGACIAAAGLAGLYGQVIAGGGK